jgi:hypothetical protein
LSKRTFTRRIYYPETLGNFETGKRNIMLSCTHHRQFRHSQELQQEIAVLTMPVKYLQYQALAAGVAQKKSGRLIGSRQLVLKPSVKKV